MSYQPIANDHFMEHYSPQSEGAIIGRKIMHAIKRFPKAFILGLLAFSLALAGAQMAFSRVQAGMDEKPLAQPTPFLTPTPRADGRIVYVVQEDDTLWRIAAIAGLSLEELMALNGIQPGDFLTPGTELFLGSAIADGGEATAQASASEPTEIPLTPTPEVGTGDICVLLFEDINGNGRLEENEPALPQGQISVVALSGDMVGEYTTEPLDLEVAPDGYCFEELSNGDYNVSAAVPSNYNPTTGLNVPVSLNPGEIKYLQFGAQPSSALGQDDNQGGGRSPLLGLVGLALLAAAGGLAYYASRMSRRTPPPFR
jgi:LysM repeat protein